MIEQSPVAPVAPPPPPSPPPPPPKHQQPATPTQSLTSQQAARETQPVREPFILLPEVPTALDVVAGADSRHETLDRDNAMVVLQRGDDGDGDGDGDDDDDDADAAGGDGYESDTTVASVSSEEAMWVAKAIANIEWIGEPIARANGRSYYVGFVHESRAYCVNDNIAVDSGDSGLDWKMRVCECWEEEASGLKKFRGRWYWSVAEVLQRIGRGAKVPEPLEV